MIASLNLLDLLMSEKLNSQIEMLRNNYNVIIYNKMEPYVSPLTGKIIFCYSVKQCNIRDGWNGRIYIGTSDYTPYIYVAKAQAVIIALDYLINNDTSLDDDDIVRLCYNKLDIVKLLRDYENEKKI